MLLVVFTVFVFGDISWIAGLLHSTGVYWIVIVFCAVPVLLYACILNVFIPGDNCTWHWKFWDMGLNKNCREATLFKYAVAFSYLSTCLIIPLINKRLFDVEKVFSWG